jgi:hypothetical protein
MRRIFALLLCIAIPGVVFAADAQSYLRWWFAGRYQSWIWPEASHQFVDRDISAGQIGEGQHPGIGDYRN